MHHPLSDLDRSPERDESHPEPGKTDIRPGYQCYRGEHEERQEMAICVGVYNLSQGTGNQREKDNQRREEPEQRTSQALIGHWETLTVGAPFVNLTEPCLKTACDEWMGRAKPKPTLQ